MPQKERENEICLSFVIDEIKAVFDICRGNTLIRNLKKKTDILLAAVARNT